MSQNPPPPYNPEKGGYPPASYPQDQYPPPQGQYTSLQGQYPPPQGQYQPLQGQYPAGQQYPPGQQYPQGQQYPPGQQYPQGQAYPPAPHPGTTVVTQPATGTNVVVVTGGQGFGAQPCQTTCCHCNAQIVTTTETVAGSFAWIIVLIVTAAACVVFPFALLGCCFIPLCIPELRDVQHFCPNCRKEVGRFKRKF